MNEKKLQELKYDLDRETNVKKAHALIEKYMYYQLAGNQKTEKISSIDKGMADLQDVLDIQCSSGNWDYDEYMQGMANGLILARSCITGEDPKFLDAPDEGFIANRSKVEPEKCTCGPGDACSFCPDDDIKKFGKKGSAIVIRAAQNLFDNRIGWSEQRNLYAPRNFWADLGASLYGEDDERVKELRNEVSDERTGTGTDVSDSGTKKQSHDIEFPKDHNEEISSSQSIEIKVARRVLRKSFEDEGYKLAWMANMRMFINDRTDVLIDEQVIYDMLDYIFKE